MSHSFESFGKYVLLEKLATGGMAEVFLARGSGAGGIGKFFAVKRILPQYADSPEFIEMFKDEAKIAINLSHSNIVSIHEFGVEKGQFFLVMDYVEGRNLRQILNKMKKSGLQFSIDQIIYIIKEVGAGLDHAHRCIDGTTGKPLNITHRDMSPQNVMVSFEGETKIVDFGIAKAESQIETTRAGTLKGKFGYMSPEQAEGQPVDLRTDIFSLGIVLWELLANDRLFVANNEINTLRKIRDCQIPSLRKINPNIHTELERIVQKSLARDRNLRYQTGAALHRDLNRFLNRQYPDFSPQDFAVFIKSVFADEILSLRKRLVEYAKMNLGSGNYPPTANFDDRTSLLDTSTNSLVVSDQDSNPSGSATGKKSNSGISVSQDPSEDSSSTVPPLPNTQARSIPSVNTRPREATSVTNVGTHTGDFPQATRTDPNSLPTPRAAANSLVFDEKALAIALESDIAKSKTGGIETEEVSQPSFNARSYNSRTQGRYRQGPAVQPKKRGTARVATFIVFALLCTAVYSYLVKYFTPIMGPVIEKTDPYLSTLHDALGVARRQTACQPGTPGCHDQYQVQNPEPNQSGTNPVDPTPGPGPAVQVQQPQAQPQPRQLPQPAPQLPEATSAVLVISNPSGAQILINDKETGMITPSRIEVPTNGKFSLGLRKHGFAEYKQRDLTHEQLGHRFTYNLTKSNVAYLDIDVFPPQDAVIYINGKLVTGRFPIRDLPVMANIPLHIRAETKNGLSADEVTVNLPVDKKQPVQLNPRKSLRVPSGDPSQK